MMKPGERFSSLEIKEKHAKKDPTYYHLDLSYSLCVHSLQENLGYFWIFYAKARL